jgi:hypothetical protein
MDVGQWFSDRVTRTEYGSARRRRSTVLDFSYRHGVIINRGTVAMVNDSGWGADRHRVRETAAGDDVFKCDFEMGDRLVVPETAGGQHVIEVSATSAKAAAPAGRSARERPPM